ncbi:MAG: nucleotidyl transferase AbiEii/AbiGii toxin family protein [Verrucomicrobiales bacterium]|nr:nucleotidyl transferase AbiEii/AbiGii toxin family protein [Verrucomicrobiales bacterium]
MLTPEAEVLWEFLKEQPALRGFVLVGGSALSLRIDHRLSEDLDFLYCDIHLPKARLARLVEMAAEAGFVFERNDDPAAWDEFEIAGMDLHLSQQDFLVNGKVKVTFFCASSSLAKVIATDPESACRIAEISELFDSKALVSASRSKTRDWYDLFILMRDQGYSIQDYIQAFSKAGVPHNADTGLDRLTTGMPRLNDEGYESLIDSAPTLNEMTDFFRRQRDAYEIARAERAWSIKRSNSTDLP